MVSHGHDTNQAALLGQPLLTCARNSLCARLRASVLRVWCFSNSVSDLLMRASSMLMPRMASTTPTWLLYCRASRPSALLQ